MKKLLFRLAVALSILIVCLSATWWCWQRWWSGEMLIGAIVDGNTGEALWLLTLGARIDLGDGAERTALEHAVIYEDEEVIRRLVAENGVANDPRIFWVAAGRSASTVKLLLDLGFDASSEASSAPLINAIKIGEWKSVDLLLDAGADPNIKLAPGYHLVDFALSRLDEPSVKSTIIRMFRAGADPDLRILRFKNTANRQNLLKAWPELPEILEKIREERSEAGTQ